MSRVCKLAWGPPPGLRNASHGRPAPTTRFLKGALSGPLRSWTPALNGCLLSAAAARWWRGDGCARLSLVSLTPWPPVRAERGFATRRRPSRAACFSVRVFGPGWLGQAQPSCDGAEDELMDALARCALGHMIAGSGAGQTVRERRRGRSGCRGRRCPGGSRRSWSDGRRAAPRRSTSSETGSRDRAAARSLRAR